MKSNMIKCWFLLVLLMLAACQEKEELASTAKGSVSLKATIESDGTRTSVDEEGHVSWVETDAIGVFGEETRNAKFQSISSGSSVFFVGEMSSRQDIPTLAYYPYDENAVLDGNTLHFTLPSEYQYTGESNAPMLGIKQADGDFMFKHLCGLLKVTIKNMPENAKRLFVVSEGTEEKEAPAIAGDVVVSDVTAEGATLSIAKNGGHEVSIDLKNTSAQETYTFYLPVPVGEYPKLSVKLEMNDGVIYMDKSVSNVKMVRAKMLDMPVLDAEKEKTGITAIVRGTVDIENPEGLIIQSMIDYNTLNENVFYVEILKNELPQNIFLTDKDGNVRLMYQGYISDNIEINAETTALALITMTPILTCSSSEDFTTTLESIKGTTSFYKLVREVQNVVNSEIDIYSEDNTELYQCIADVFSELLGKSQSRVVHIGKDIKGVEAKHLSVKTDNTQVVIRNTGLKPPYEYSIHYKNKIIENGILKAPPMHGFISLLSGEIGTNHYGPSVGFIPPFQGEYYFYFDNTTEKAKNEFYMVILNDFLSSCVGMTLSELMGFAEITVNTYDFIQTLAFNFSSAKSGEISYDKASFESFRAFVFFASSVYDGISEMLDKEGVVDGKYKALGNTLKVIRKALDRFLTIYNGIKGVANISTRFVQAANSVAVIDFKLCYYQGIMSEIVCCSETFLDIVEGDKQIGVANEQLEHPLVVSINTTSFHGKEFWNDRLYVKFEVEEGDGRLKNYVEVDEVTKQASVDWVLGYSGEQKVKVVAIDLYTELEISEPVYFTAYFEPEEEEGTITTTEATNITQTTATLSGNIQGYEADDFGHRYGIIYSTDTNPTASNGTIAYSNNIQEDGNYSVNVTSLVKNNTYYYRAFVVNGGNYVYGDVMSFTTKRNFNSLREALIYLYNTTGGNNWINNDNWCSDLPIEEWYGISVDTWSKKLHIDLSGNNLTGFVDFKAETTEESNIFSNVGRLYFNDNNLTSIDISGIRGVGLLDCAGNPLSAIFAENCPDLSSFGCDERNYEQSSIVDKIIDLSNCTMLNTINCPSSNVVELKIDGCSSLENLMCMNNKLVTLDFTGCNAIYYLNLDYNNIVTLNLNGKESLEQLTVVNNKLTSINIDGCTSLSYLALSSNSFETISLCNLNSLKIAYLYNNMLGDVNFVNCPSLRDLSLGTNKLQKLDVSSLPSLEYLNIEKNEVSELNIEGCNNLAYINVNRNKLATLDLSGYAKLKTLYCHYNDMIYLNLDGCIALENLRCVGNKLTEMNVEHCTQLKELECSANNILKEITEFFMNLEYFKYDRRYYYFKQDDGSIKVEEQRVGWWYHGEPDKLEHKP